MANTKPRGIYLVRHGATKLNSSNKRDDRIRGWLNPPLTDEGKRSAEQSAQALTDRGIYAVRSSDLVRAADTARIIANVIKVPVQTSKSFRPWDLGTMQGKSSAAAQPQLQLYAERKPEVHVPNGESFDDFKQRLLPAFQKLIEEAKGHNYGGYALCLVTHFRDIKLIQSWLAKGADDSYTIDVDTFFADDVDPADIYYLSTEGPKLPTKMELINVSAARQDTTSAISSLTKKYERLAADVEMIKKAKQ